MEGGSAERLTPAPPSGASVDADADVVQNIVESVCARVAMCPSLIRYGAYGLFLVGPPREYKRPRSPKFSAQYQLSYLRLTRFRTPLKSIQNV